MHDIVLTLKGDIVPNWNGGLSEDDNDPIDIQDINWRTLTNNPEMFRWAIGANLEDLIGRPNIPSTGTSGQKNITSALTFDSRFSMNAVNVKSVPISFNAIQFFVGVSKVDTSFSTVPLFSTILVVNL